MGWKSLAWISCLLPVLTGCESTRCCTQSRANKIGSIRAHRGSERDSRNDAHAAWRTVCSQYPQRTFTNEFHDGFLDGYVDYSERGGAAQPPTVPPIKYVRDTKYFTPEGHGLLRDYDLGFKYGTEVANAGGHRQFLTVQDGWHAPIESPNLPGTPTIPYTPTRWKTNQNPMPLPQPRVYDPLGGSKFGAPKKSDDPLPGLPEPQPPLPSAPGPGKPVPPPPKPELPLIKPLNPDLSGGKFAPPPVVPDPDLLPVPSTPIPIPDSQIELPPPPPEEPKSSVPRILEPFPVRAPSFKIGLSVAPEEMSPPATAPSLPILGDLPVIPFRAAPPAPNENPLSSKR